MIDRKAFICLCGAKPLGTLKQNLNIIINQLTQILNLYGKEARRQQSLAQNHYEIESH